MQLCKTLVAMLSVLAATNASPTARADANTEADVAQVQVEERGLEKRESHQANVYNQIGCSNGYINSVYSFGCGGHCYNFGQGIASVYLQYSGSGNKPTADCFTSSDCSGNVNTHNGIASGQSGCTSQNNLVYSCYFYYGC